MCGRPRIHCHCHGTATVLRLGIAVVLLLHVRAQADEKASEAIGTISGVTEVPNELPPNARPDQGPALGRRPGRYVPELHGAARGKYVPDYRGFYQHIHVPYDGGYGDRGLKYHHFLDQQAGREFGLGPRDHLRFTIDFNYNGSGWQVIEFDWVRDGDEDHQINYVNENKIGARKPQAKPGSSVHVEGEVDANNGDNQEQVNSIQSTISDVLEYIQTYILPTLS